MGTLDARMLTLNARRLSSSFPPPPTFRPPLLSSPFLSSHPAGPRKRINCVTWHLTCPHAPSPMLSGSGFVYTRPPCLTPFP
ncbi:hypothetical protein EVG20_g9790 [Dentipellis fragilis]|uniref:Uncharacterized protein n=1 Tax=Dentipellis fragilis TaxID=205917 RepID=A0A4Y9XWT0_9AGAM|nr:hypothetical protein EVG20_g9790 [Dentipellis fragilis]